MNFIWYIIIGAVAGFAAGKITKGKGGGFCLNLLIGIIGSVLGGWLFGVLGINTNEGSIMGNLVTSTVGAIVLLCLVSVFQKKDLKNK
ncbi:MAG: GlsB/YeaQ/YmgE family stress response membrane protein [Candidatus Azobacteroides sp.]|nr:GlsB/YeaQ/YmgE family stress response membrane protein [Candidatus Azobacteroides sp.]